MSTPESNEPSDPRIPAAWGAIEGWVAHVVPPDGCDSGQRSSASGGVGRGRGFIRFRAGWRGCGGDALRGTRLLMGPHPAPSLARTSIVTTVSIFSTLSPSPAGSSKTREGTALRHQRRRRGGSTRHRRHRRQSRQAGERTRLMKRLGIIVFLGAGHRGLFRRGRNPRRQRRRSVRRFRRANTGRLPIGFLRAR